jgi:hypothetical protein
MDVVGKNWTIQTQRRKGIVREGRSQGPQKPAALSAETVQFSSAQAQNAPGFVTGVEAMRPSRFERNHFRVKRLCAVDGGNTPARQRVQRIEGVRSNMSRTTVVSVLHVRPSSGRQRAY